MYTPFTRLRDLKMRSSLYIMPYNISESGMKWNIWGFGIEIKRKLISKTNAHFFTCPLGAHDCVFSVYVLSGQLGRVVVKAAISQLTAASATGQFLLIRVDQRYKQTLAQFKWQRSNKGEINTAPFFNFSAISTQIIVMETFSHLGSNFNRLSYYL